MTTKLVCFLALIGHIFAASCRLQKFSLLQNDFPENAFVVSLKRKAFVGNYYYHFCTGSILSEDWILTAAHCFKEKYIPLDYLAVDAGSLRVTGEGGTRYPVKEYIVHPNQTQSIQIYRNDLCLVRLDKPITFSGNVKAAQLGTIKDQEERPVIAGGWGRQSQNGNLNSRLRWVDFKTLRYSECQRMHAPRNNIVDRETHICAFTGTTKTLCFGDSGGPMFDRASGKQVAVFSAIEDCSGNYPVLLMRIEVFLDWINEVTKLGITI